MRAARCIRFGCFLFEGLIALYPPSFRAEYGEEMRLVFQEASEEALSRRGLQGLLGVWLSTLSDFVVASTREHLAAGTHKAFLAGLCIAIGGLGIGYLDFHASEVQPIVGLILIFSFSLGATRPAGAWKWVLCAGGGIPAVHLLGSAIGVHPNYPVQPNVGATFLALIPAAIGVYLGVGIRALTTSVRNLL